MHTSTPRFAIATVLVLLSVALLADCLGSELCLLNCCRNPEQADVQCKWCNSTAACEASTTDWCHPLRGEFSQHHFHCGSLTRRRERAARMQVRRPPPPTTVSKRCRRFRSLLQLGVGGPAWRVWMVAGCDVRGRVKASLREALTTIGVWVGTGSCWFASLAVPRPSRKESRIFGGRTAVATTAVSRGTPRPPRCCECCRSGYVAFGTPRSDREELVLDASQLLTARAIWTRWARGAASTAATDSACGTRPATNQSKNPRTRNSHAPQPWSVTSPAAEITAHRRRQSNRNIHTKWRPAGVGVYLGVGLIELDKRHHLFPGILGTRGVAPRNELFLLASGEPPVPTHRHHHHPSPVDDPNTCEDVECARRAREMEEDIPLLGLARSDGFTPLVVKRFSTLRRVLAQTLCCRRHSRLRFSPTRLPYIQTKTYLFGGGARLSLAIESRGMLYLPRPQHITGGLLCVG